MDDALASHCSPVAGELQRAYADGLTAPATAETIEPETALTAAYEDAYQRYRRLYPAIRAAY